MASYLRIQHSLQTAVSILVLGEITREVNPVTIYNTLNNKKIPLYGDGLNVRDWLFVEDHIDGILLVLSNGRIEIPIASEVKDLQIDKF